ncbi:MAG: ribosome biogenesis GTPase Der [Chromatiales bacterium 21-64-14]|nr:MAG: ribosome biogenesis GTPase Der [Chromatiales bacterium 21-64-14]HQU15027.1 ribosome biogenesis GTPase Der [Gammaproteobacteria bacterium]
MLPTLVLVGRPNVGKSTLFNQLTRSRDALVADQPGLTRDRIYGVGRVGERAYLVVDTGGLTDGAAGLEGLVIQQTLHAVQEAQAVVFLVDGRAGLTPDDEAIAMQLRRSARPIFLGVNKTEGLDPAVACAEFHRLGLGDTYPIAAAHGRGLDALMEAVYAAFPATAEEPESADDGVRVAVVGRPNAGKSTLVNRLLGEERVVTFDLPGTTRDSVFIPFERAGRRYTLIDTAGLRRRGRVTEMVEKFSAVKTLQAIERAHVVILVVDAREGIGHQDAALLGFILEGGRALVVAVNKWDGLSQDQRDRARRELDLKLSFVDYAPVRLISALHGTGVGDLFDSVGRVYDAATRKLSTPQLTRILEKAVRAHTPPLVNGRVAKLRYAHPGGVNPPTVVIHGTRTRHLPETYRRYLANTFRVALELEGTPVRLEFREGENPYKPGGSGAAGRKKQR